jgi:uncharacterized protein (TIGR02271 family)
VADQAKKRDDHGDLTAGNAGSIGFNPTHDTAREIALSETIPVLEETLSVSKRQIKTGTVRVSTRTETHEEFAELSLDRTIIDVTRVHVDRVVDAAPKIRTEGDTTIVPVLEERLVVVKQLVLVEELHIRRTIEQKVTRTPVLLRQQHVDIQHLDADGQPVDDGG